ncbi:MAG: 3-hydroxyacyl-CoA dehydrogenase NAD-binding domain-containing protein [Gemmobacter sp.]|nr:3-hydroxyacyl-CoA dehydrogenase NAD-binding domain-containing protein [Gemmobacter sp.]
MARKAAIIGGGVIGGGWAARFLLNGWNVSVFDPDPDTPRKIAETLGSARMAMASISDLPMPPEGTLTFAQSIAEAAQGARYIQETVPERLDLKHQIIAQIQQVSPECPLGSSGSGFKPSELQQGAVNPGTIFTAHPVDPVYLLPLVEIVASPASDPALIEAVKETLRNIGMYPLHVSKDIDGAIADRLQSAVMREALGLVRDGVATAGEIDQVIRMGLGLRWGQVALFGSDLLAGKDAETTPAQTQRGLLADLKDAPDVTGETGPLIERLSVADFDRPLVDQRARLRDRNLIGFLRVLKDRDWGAGKVLLDYDERRRSALPDPTPDIAAPMVIAHMQVLPAWIDYNGHMTESRYLFACSETTDAFLRLIGAGLDYVAGGYSYYTAETHILHKGEAKLGEHLTGSVQVLGADEKRLHLFVRIERGGQTVATLEQMLLHVDMKAGRACASSTEIQSRLLPIAVAHRALPVPEGAGRHVGQRRE